MVQQGAGFANQLGKVRFRHIPNQPVIHIGVTVDQNGTEGDYSLEVGNLPGRSFSYSCQFVHCFSNNLKLTLHC